MGIKFLDTINKELNEIQENKNQISKEISELRATLEDLHTEKNSIKENMKITDKLKVMGLSKKIRETEQEVKDLEEILEVLKFKTIDYPREEVEKEYQKYINKSELVEEYKKLLDAKKTYEEQLNSFNILASNLYEESREIKRTLIENIDSFKNLKDPYGFPRIDILKLDNRNMLKELENIGYIGFETAPNSLNDSIRFCILNL